MAVIDGGAIDQHIAFLNPVALLRCRMLVDTGALVGAIELTQGVGALGAIHLSHHDPPTSHTHHFTWGLGQHHLARAKGGRHLHASYHSARFGAQEGHCLALLVSPHQCPVGIIML